jgi:hypothetical protein
MRKAAKPLEGEEFPNAKPEDEWKKELNGSEYRMLRQQGTEAPGRGEYHTFFPQEGFFGCRACKFPLVRRLVSKSLTKSAHIPWPCSVTKCAWIDALLCAAVLLNEQVQGLRLGRLRQVLLQR